MWLSDSESWEPLSLRLDGVDLVVVLEDDVVVLFLRDGNGGGRGLLDHHGRRAGLERPSRNGADDDRGGLLCLKRRKHCTAG